MSLSLSVLYGLICLHSEALFLSGCSALRMNGSVIVHKERRERERRKLAKYSHGTLESIEVASVVVGKEK